MRLERQVQHLLGTEGVLEHLRCGRKSLVDVPASQAEIERDVGALAALEMIEIGESAGGLELFMNEGHVFGRLDLIKHRRQFLVFGDDFLHRLLGNVWVAGEHDSDRFADKMHLADGKDWLVVEGRAVMGIRDHFTDVVAGVNAEDAGDFARGTHGDRLDAAVRHRTAVNLGVQHAGQLHDVGVFGAAGNLFTRLDARQRTTDLPADGRGRSHQGAPMAARTARAV